MKTFKVFCFSSDRFNAIGTFNSEKDAVLNILKHGKSNKYVIIKRDTEHEYSNVIDTIEFLNDFKVINTNADSLEDYEVEGGLIFNGREISIKKNSIDKDVCSGKKNKEREFDR